jgi:hypothetical protein
MSCQVWTVPELQAVSTNTMNKLYTDPSRRFSFEYPDTYRLRNQGAGFDFLIIETPHTGELLLQIYGMPFDDGLLLTPDRIRGMYPAIRVDHFAHCSVGRAHTVDALSFKSSRPNESFTNEVWFVYRDRLYQVVAPTDSQLLLDSVIASWVFDPSE